MSSLLRIVFAFALACLAAGLVQVLFVKTPADLLALPIHDRAPFLESAGRLTLVAATQSAYFAAPFALIAVITSYALGIKNRWFYTLTGLAIAALALFALFRLEPDNTPTLLNSRAALAFGLSGLIGGWVYAYCAGIPSQAKPSRTTYRPNRPHAHAPRNDHQTTENIEVKKKTSPPPLPANDKKIEQKKSERKIKNADTTEKQATDNNNGASLDDSLETTPRVRATNS